MTYERIIKENEDFEWKKSGDEECDEPSDIVKFNEKKTFPRTEPKVVSRRSLLTKLIHGNDGKSSLQNIASCSSLESRRSRIPNDSRAFFSSNTRHEMMSKKMTKSLQRELL